MSAGGKRVTTGTYLLAPDGTDRTKVTFSFAYEQATRSDRLTAPLTRAFLRRGNETAMRRLKALLEAPPMPRR